MKRFSDLAGDSGCLEDIGRDRVLVAAEQDEWKGSPWTLGEQITGEVNSVLLAEVGINHARSGVFSISALRASAPLAQW